MSGKEEIISLYKELYGYEPEGIEKIASGGSHRDYYRLYGGGTSVIGTIGVSVAENEAFIYLSEKFGRRGLNVPEILIANNLKTGYLQSDLGGKSLYDFLMSYGAQYRYSTGNMTVLKKVIHDLVSFQYAGKEDFDYNKCYPVREMDETAILWDLNYYKYCFLKAIGIEINEPELEKEFRILSNICAAKSTDGFMYRDFQSRNIFIGKNGNPGYIDYQGGRKGNGFYDLVSFLWQARIAFPDEVKSELIKEYLDVAKDSRMLIGQDENNQIEYFVLLRVFQTLGAYGLRGITERKAIFRDSIYASLHNLMLLSDATYSRFPYLKDLISICEEKFRPQNHVATELTVTVGSFSYHKGLPEDKSGNGGGFIFDCRAINNPGRHEKYKKMTGRDRKVIEFIENENDTEKFVKNIFEIIDQSIEEYRRRNFTSLSVWTGCTGGQHRSVYFADRIARHLHEKYGVRINLVHRERGINEWLESI